MKTVVVNRHRAVIVFWSHLSGHRFLWNDRLFFFDTRQNRNTRRWRFSIWRRFRCQHLHVIVFPDARCFGGHHCDELYPDVFVPVTIVAAKDVLEVQALCSTDLQRTIEIWLARKPPRENTDIGSPKSRYVRDSIATSAANTVG